MKRPRLDADLPMPLAKPVKYCQLCGTSHDGSNGRSVCPNCPKQKQLPAGCIVEHDNKILLCKRNTDPSRECWTFPVGYREYGEDMTEAAIRETLKKTNADVEKLCSFAIIETPAINQVLFVFIAKMKSSDVSLSPDCCFFSIDEIPLDKLAFSSTLVTLKWYIEAKKNGINKYFRSIIIYRRLDKPPSEISAYTIKISTGIRVIPGESSNHV